MQRNNLYEQVTIAIPVYERTDFFNEAIESALNQTVKCTIVVVDNASSHTYFKDYIEKLDNPRVKYFRNDQNLGMVGNWNRCIEVAQTPYLSILNDDDVLHPQFLERVFPILDEKEMVVCANYSMGPVTAAEFYSSHHQGGLNFTTFKLSSFLFGNLTPSVGAIFPVSVAREIGGYEQYYYPAQDYHFWIKMAKRIPVLRGAEKLSFYRISENQTSNTVFYQIVGKTFEIRRQIASFAKFQTLSILNLYYLYKFYLKNSAVLRDDSNLSAELASQFARIDRVCKGKAGAFIIKGGYHLSLRILGIFKVI